MFKVNKTAISNYIINIDNKTIKTKTDRSKGLKPLDERNIIRELKSKGSITSRSNTCVTAML